MSATTEEPAHDPEESTLDRALGDLSDIDSAVDESLGAPGAAILSVLMASAIGVGFGASVISIVLAVIVGAIGVSGLADHFRQSRHHSAPKVARTRRRGVLALTLVWFMPWVLLLTHQDRGITTTAYVGAVLAVSDAYALFGILLRRRTRNVVTRAVVIGFLLTLAALVATWAWVDLEASRATVGCFYDAAHPSGPLDLLNSVYFALTTVTTVGFGDIAPHTPTCRAFTTGELAFGLPMIGMVFAGVTARLFRDFAN